MSEILKEEMGYIIFIYPGSQFYIRTSFNPSLCPVRPGFFYDMDTGKYVPKSLVQGVKMEVHRDEPSKLRQQSEFWKSILLGDTHAGA
jgi:hypothetical protein